VPARHARCLIRVEEDHVAETEEPVPGKKGFIRRHPAAALAALAGVGALAGAEWAAGALLGMAALALVSPRVARERAALITRGKALLERARARLHEWRGTEARPPDTMGA
jgi:hypothetical protein